MRHCVKIVYPLLLLIILPAWSTVRATQVIQPRDVVLRSSDVPAGFSQYTAESYTAANFAPAAGLTSTEVLRDGFTSGYTVTLWNPRNARSGRAISYIYSTATLFSSAAGAGRVFLDEQKVDLRQLRPMQNFHVLSGVTVGHARYAVEFNTQYNAPVTIAVIVFWRHQYIASAKVEVSPGAVQLFTVKAMLRRLGHIMNHRVSANRP